MTGRRTTDPEELKRRKDRILDLRRAGLSYTVIAQRLGLSWTTIRKIVRATDEQI